MHARVAIGEIFALDLPVLGTACTRTDEKAPPTAQIATQAPAQSQ